MSIALDIGTSRLRSLRREGVELIGRSVPAAFSIVDDDAMSRRLLAKADLSFATGDGELALIGDAALEHAAAFHAARLPLLPGGMVSTDDPPARQLIGTIIESLLPEANVAAAPCGLVMPVASLADEGSTEFIVRLIKMRGYVPLVLTATHALALATLSSEGFTGVSLTIGAGGTSMSLVHRGRELAAAQDHRGTDWIDARLASALRRYTHGSDGGRFLDTESVRRQRESLSEPLTRPTSEIALKIAESYRELLEAITRDLAVCLRRENLGRFERPLSIVCAGGGTRATGFLSLLTSALASVELPCAIGETRLTPPDDFIIARGALIHAELESVSAIAA
jgi:hypothetical protein